MEHHRGPCSRKGSGAFATSTELHLASEVGLRDAQSLRTFPPSLLAFAAVFLGLLFGLTGYARFEDHPGAQVAQYYQWMVHVNIMVWVGFGFLMTFLRRYSFGAVCLNMLASAVMFLESILVLGATQQVFWNQKASYITIDLPLLIDCAFCAASGMIAFGAVIGKVSPTQLLWMVFAQAPLYALNQHLVIHTFKALDPGGTIVIHLFGAYYGLSVSFMLRSILPETDPSYGPSHPKNSSAYLNDIMSMVGTLFLWLYWPSFNGALASIPITEEPNAEATTAQQAAQFLCVVNTLLSLLGATISTFMTSALVNKGRINIMQVQNSTLAGGVAMGAACALQLTPGGAVLVGMSAGVLSVCGFQYLTPALDRKGLGDTCGVHNLHGMPAVLGGLVAGLAALGQQPDYLLHASGRLQLGYQVAAMAVTVAIAISGGLVVGFLMCLLNPTGTPHLQHVELFDDGLYWHGVAVEPLMAVSLADASKHSIYSVSRYQPAGGVGYSMHRATNGALFSVGGTHHSLEASQHHSRHTCGVPVGHPAAVQLPQAPPEHAAQLPLGVHVVHLGLAAQVGPTPAQATHMHPALHTL